MCVMSMFTHSISKWPTDDCHTIGIGYDKIKRKWGRVWGALSCTWDAYFPTSNVKQLSLGWKGMERKSSSLTMLIFYVWIFHIARNLALLQNFSLAFNFRVDMQDRPPTFSFSSLFTPFLYDCVRVGSPNLLFFCSFNLSVYINELCSSRDRVSMRCFGMTMKNEITRFSQLVGAVRGRSHTDSCDKFKMQNDALIYVEKFLNENFKLRSNKKFNEFRDCECMKQLETCTW